MDTAAVAASEPGQSWFRYRRPDPSNAVPAGPTDLPEPALIEPDDEVPTDHWGRPRPGGLVPPSRAAAPSRVAPPAPLAVPDRFPPVPPGGVVGPAVIGVGILLVAAGIAQAGIDSAGPWLVPVGALFLAAAAGRALRRRHPDEPWLGQWLLAGTAFKLLVSFLRYLTVVIGYGGGGDSEIYDKFGRRYVLFWKGTGPNPALPDLRKTNFVRWFTGVTYYVFGSNQLAGFMAFGLIALIGSYFWYRATVEAVPFIDKRLYLTFVLFAPSIAFWPSSIGKESLMQLGIGAMALGTALMLTRRLAMGLPIVLASGWALWLVRPHLLALVALAGGAAYFLGRVRRKDPASGGILSLFSRPLGLLVVAVLLIFAVNQGAKFLGLNDLSLSSIQGELDATTLSTAQGGSSFDNGGNSLNPIYLPMGAVTVLLRPFPWETDNPFQLLASLESAALAVFMVVRRRSVGLSLTRARTSPFLLYCWLLTILYAATFSSFANFGLLVRQRSLVLPALFVLLCTDPKLVRDQPTPPADARNLASHALR